MDIYSLEEAYNDENEIKDADFYTEKDRTAGDKRKRDYQKAVSKRNKDISRKISFDNGTSTVHPWYSNLHQYSKNKIHCSCPLCAFNAKRHGRIIFGRTLPMGDKRREESCADQMKEYNRSA